MTTVWVPMENELLMHYLLLFVIVYRYLQGFTVGWLTSLAFFLFLPTFVVSFGFSFKHHPRLCPLFHRNIRLLGSRLEPETERSILEVLSNNFWDVLCTPIEFHPRFGGACYFHLQSWWVSQISNQQSMWQNRESRAYKTGSDMGIQREPTVTKGKVTAK